MSSIWPSSQFRRDFKRSFCVYSLVICMSESRLKFRMAESICRSVWCYSTLPGQCCFTLLIAMKSYRSFAYSYASCFRNSCISLYLLLFCSSASLNLILSSSIYIIWDSDSFRRVWISWSFRRAWLSLVAIGANAFGFRDIKWAVGSYIFSSLSSLASRSKLALLPTPFSAACFLLALLVIGGVSNDGLRYIFNKFRN